MTIPYQRFAVFLLPASLFMFSNLNKTNATDEYKTQTIGFNKKTLTLSCGFLVVFLILLDTHKDFMSFEKNDKAFHNVLSQMEKDKTSLSLILHNDNQNFKISVPYLHFGSWYQAQHGGESLINFAYEPIAKYVMVKYAKPLWPIPSAWGSQQFDWRQHQGWRYDYFLVRSDRKRDDLFKASSGKVKLKAQEGQWYLYEYLKTL